MSVKDTYKSKIGEKFSGKEELWARRYPENADASELVLAVSPEDYSASRISHAVEDCDAHLLNLNVTDRRTDRGDMIVDLRVDHSNSVNVARSLERYGYEVIDFGGTVNRGSEAERARERADEILRILNM